ncbi:MULTISPECIES: MFS transporter [unclassified Pseudomonas]|uniref:MFS transporter n=1 Tax=unclassified Pseudomonas TaxID=196821 RepID=UPI00244BC8C1|nr:MULTISPECIES: MFS transporter [unclassified Pseudomonas]MDG9923056.1 MFS transporter [Pseudomonas sp. GD04045]MDH0035580.1 MFS transporter [Pseudomonas sp. GD04019]
MDALLILGGLLLILAGLVWLVMRAFSTGLLWGWGSLIPPITLIYVLRHWRTARKAVGLVALGVIPLVVGMVLMASQDAARLEAILSLRWLKEQPKAPAELAIRLHGELDGQPFNPQYAELVDGVLSLREGEDFFARREVTIRLPQGQKAPIKLDVLPEDAGQLPEVEISWLLPEQDLPEARRLSKGYTLHLDLQALPPNKLQGDFHLVLPPTFKTSLSGSLELFSDRLRYKDGRLDASFDSRETLAKVIDDYLQRRFATRLVQLAELPEVVFPATRLPVAVQARVNGEAQNLELVLEKGGRGWQVQGDHYPALAEPRAAEPAKPAPEAEPVVAQNSRPALDRRQRFSLPRLQRNPEQYRNLSMRVSKAAGGTVEGRFIGVDGDGSIRLSQQLGGGGGQASFSFKPDEIGKIELLEP